MQQKRDSRELDEQVTQTVNKDWLAPRRKAAKKD